MFYAAAGSHVETVLGVVTSIVIARSLGAERYGMYSLLLMWATIAQMIVNSGVALGAQRFVAQAQARGQPEVASAIARRLRTVQLIKLAAALVVVGAALPIYGAAGAAALSVVGLALVLASIAFRTQYTFNVAVCKGAGDFRSAAVVAWAGSGANVLLVCMAGLFLPEIHGFLLAYAMSTAAFFAVSTWRSRRLLVRHGGAEIPVDVQNDLSRHLRVVTVSTVLAHLASSQIEIFFLGLWSPAEQIGFFRLGNMLAAGAVGVVSGVVASVVLPYLSGAIAKGNAAAAESYARLTRYLVLLAAPVVVLVIVLSRTLIVTVYGAQYADAALVLSVLVAALALADVNTPAQAYLLGAGRQYTVLAFTVIALALKLIAGTALIHQFGLEGAIASLAGTVVIISIAKSWLVRRDLGVRFPVRITVRCLAVAAVAALPAMIMTALLPGPVALVLGSVTFAVIYPLLVLYGRFLSAEEIERGRAIASAAPALARRMLLHLLAFARSV